MTKRASSRRIGPGDTLTKIIEKNADGILIVNHAGMILFLNPSAVTLLGRNSGELMQEPFGFPATDAPSGIEILQKGGSIRYGEMRGVELEWEGQPALLISIRDVTERRELEKALADKEKLEAIKILSNTFAHQIFNAITPIQGYAELIMKNTDSADNNHDYALQIVNASRESVTLVNKLKSIESYSPKKFGGVDILDTGPTPENPSK